MSSLATDTSNLASHFRAVQYTTISSMTILVYDWTITYNDEVEHVWRSGWSLVKILFFGTRYIPLISTMLVCIYFFYPGLQRDICSRLIKTSDMLNAVGITVAIGILLMRTHALWGNSRKLLIVLSATLFAAFVYGVVVLSVDQSMVKFSKTGISGIVPCMSGEEETANVPVFAIYICIMLLDSIVIGLTMYKTMSEWGFHASRSVLYRIFHRDGLLYFVCMFTLSSVNLIISVLNVAKGDYNHLLLQLQCSFHSIISARMILNLRTASTELVTGKNIISLSAIEFVSQTGDSDTAGTDTSPSGGTQYKSARDGD